MQIEKKFSILITTKNRINDLSFTLTKIRFLLDREDVICMICDDGSTDGTALVIKENYPEIQLIRNDISKGLIYSRNILLGMVTTEFAISIDDDSHFITSNPLEIIEQAFCQNPKIGVLGFRIYWNLEEPEITICEEVPHRMKSFVGCGHAWRMGAWKDIPDYPAWFIFYGEEDFASYHLFKKSWEIHYLPEVLVNHRVNVKSRKKNADYGIRLRYSLRSGWYLYFMFYPLSKIPKLFLYTLWIQLKQKVFKGDFKALWAIFRAMSDCVYNIPRLIKQSNRLSKPEFLEFSRLVDSKLYWKSKEKEK